PCGPPLIWGRSLESIEVDTHLIAFFHRARVDGGHRNLHFAVPDLRLLIDASLYFIAGIPGNSPARLRILTVNVEIDPLAHRGDLEFLVSLDVVEIGADEDFRDVVVP